MIAPGMALLVKNGTVVTAAGQSAVDVRCHEGRIVEVGPELEPSGEEILDASGQYVLPGGVDPHVHMQLPVAGTVSSDDFESGTAAALAGGTTTVIDFVHPEKSQDFFEALVERRRESAKAVCDYGLHMAVTWWGERTAEWMARAVEEGLSTFKTYMAYKDVVGLEDRELIRALQAAADLGALTVIHAEHGDMIEHLRDRLASAGNTEPRYHAESRPSELEGEATARAIALAHWTGARLYVFHVTCQEAAAAIARARQRGQDVYGETCPHYLLLDDSVYDRPDFEGAAYVCAPPIRPKGHQKELWQALATGSLQVVSTDHCPFNQDQRELGRDDFRLIPGGTAGIEHRLALLYTHGVGAGRIDLNQFVDLVATRPARLFGLYPRKGAVRAGSDADLVLWDPEATGTISASSHHHRCDRSIFEGFEVRGLPTTVVAGGQVRYRGGSLEVETGAGRFLHRALVE
jgi:dihydropyrimidinase